MAIDIFRPGEAPSMSNFNKRIQQANSDLLNKVNLTGSMAMTGNFGTDLGESFGGFRVKRTYGAVQGEVILGNTVLDGKPGAAVTLLHNGLEVATLRFNSNGPSMYYKQSGKDVPLATATKPEKHPLPLEAGFTAFRTTEYCVAQNSLVLVMFGVQRHGAGTADAVIARLPPGFRPGGLISTGALVENASKGRSAAIVDIAPDGTVLVYSTSADWVYAFGQAAFYAIT